MKSVKEKEKEIFAKMKGEFGYKNPMQAPRLLKVVISSGIGSIKDKNKVKVIEDRLPKITGQKPIIRGSKKSIASFKSREGDPVGIQTTLRGTRMYGFLDKLFSVAFPRTKDFRGIKRSAIDSMGNITLGIKEHTVFPETSDEELKDVFGIGVTITSTASTKKEAEVFFTEIGLPFEKIEQKK